VTAGTISESHRSFFAATNAPCSRPRGSAPIYDKAMLGAKVVLLCLYRDYVGDVEKASVLAGEFGALLSTWCVSGRLGAERAREMFGY
jgi:hypothetical protein